MKGNKELAWFLAMPGALIVGAVLTAPDKASPQQITQPVMREYIPRQSNILPPVEYDHQYEGDLTIKMVPTLADLYRACSVYNNPVLLACSYRYASDVMRERGWNTGLLLRHEIGHCNGWPGDHP